MDWQQTKAHGNPTSLTLTNLVHVASDLGYAVHLRHLDNPSILAVTDTRDRTISISFGLTPTEQRSILAHELGHAYYGHECSTPRNERDANAFAADLLIDAPTYAQLEREGSCVHDIAEHFGVTEDVIHAYQRHCLQRLGHITYGTRHRGRFTNLIARTLART